MGVINHLKEIIQPSTIKRGGSPLGNTQYGLRFRCTPNVVKLLGEETGVHTQVAVWGGMDISCMSSLLQVYDDADVMAAAFSAYYQSSVVTIPDDTNFPVGKRIDNNATLSPAFLMEPINVPGLKVTIIKCFSIIDGDLSFRLRDGTNYPVHFFPWIRSTDTFKIEKKIT